MDALHREFRVFIVHDSFLVHRISLPIAFEERQDCQEGEPRQFQVKTNN